MLTPMAQIIVYLSATFVFGLALGWLLWRFGGTTQTVAATSDIEYWKQRLEQSRIERDQQQDKVAALEYERNTLKQRLAAAKAEAQKGK